MPHQKKRNRVFKLRLSEEEYELFKKKAEKYTDLSPMVRDAVKYFNDKRAKCWIETNVTLLEHMKKYNSLLSNLGGNANQIAHRANELACQGKLTGEYFINEVMPMYKEIIKTVRETKFEVDDIYKGLLKL